MRGYRGVPPLTIVLSVILAPSRATAQDLKSLNDPMLELTNLCAARPSGASVQAVRSNFRVCDLLTHDIDKVVVSVDQHCSNIAAVKRSDNGTKISPYMAKEQLDYLLRRIGELRQVLICGALAPTFVELERIGAGARIRAIWAARANVVRQQERAHGWNDLESRCLEQALTQFDADIQRGTPSIDHRVEILSEDAKRCSAMQGPDMQGPEHRQSGVFVGLTLAGASLLVGGVATVIWGSTAVCSSRDVVGDCLDGDRVNQRRLTGWIAGGSGALIGAILGGIGIAGLVRADSPSAPRVALVLGPGHMGAQGSF